MILIYVLLAVLLVTAAAMICMMVFGLQKNKTYRFWTRAGVVASAILVTFCLVLGSIYSHDVANLQTQYNDIMLYHDVVSNCENEQVRFGHYEKISEFNNAYKCIRKAYLMRSNNDKIAYEYAKMLIINHM